VLYLISEIGLYRSRAEPEKENRPTIFLQ
jgi:hypothetical protein